jgi:hypothetical protein
VRLPPRELARRGGQGRDVGWQIAGVADLDGDDKRDLVCHHAPTGEVVVELMHGVQRLQAVEGGQVGAVGWQIPERWARVSGHRLVHAAAMPPRPYRRS